jgi:hypothetical protein
MVAKEPVAQPVEHLTFNQGVMGSNPIGLTNNISNLAGSMRAHIAEKVASKVASGARRSGK